MRLIKSMSIEDIQIEKLIPLKYSIGKKFCTLDGILDPIIDFIHKMLDTFIIFIAGKYTIFNKINYSDLTIFQNYKINLGKILKEFIIFIKIILIFIMAGKNFLKFMILKIK